MIQTEDRAIVCCRFGRYNLFYTNIEQFRFTAAVPRWMMLQALANSNYKRGGQRIALAEQYGTDVMLGFHELFDDKHDEMARFL